MKGKTKTWRSVCLRVFTTLLCVGLLTWIFSNSLQPAETSSAQSAGVVEIVQEVVSVFAPDSPIATATGEDYDTLHSVIRTLAHFTEFAVLGALFVCCWRSYTAKKAYLALPIAGICVTPVVDELLQTFSDGRAMELADVFVDMLGGACGGVAALFALWAALAIVKKVREKKGGEDGTRELGNSADKIQ
ncbi:MAG: VanZ family protein [Clostridia bacterium]|nr:VanZ family protein [Clostridia bacterium]